MGLFYFLTQYSLSQFAQAVEVEEKSILKGIVILKYSIREQQRVELKGRSSPRSMEVYRK